MKILFTASFSTSFIRNDSSFLKTQYHLTEVVSSGIFTFIRFLMYLPSTDVTFSWFASVYSSALVFFTKFFNTRSIIILGGVDVANLPELQYGIWTSRWRSIIVRYGITHADAVLAVDESLKKDAIRLARYNGDNIQIVPTGYDADRWHPAGVKTELILTVASCDSMTRFRVKGIDFLVDVACSMPNRKFLLIGLKKEIALSIEIPSNLTFIESLPQEDLLKHYQNSAVYFQPSFREGLPSTLCEAMLCECYPVGTKVGGIPTAIGETGSIIPFGDIGAAKESIEKGLAQKISSASRTRISTHFTKQQREDRLNDIILSLTNAK